MTILKLGLAAFALLLSACSNVKERYLIAIYDKTEQKSTVLQESYGPLSTIKPYQGKLLVSPMVVESDLKNKAQPEYTSYLAGKTIVLMSFPDSDSLTRYIESESSLAKAAADGMPKALYIAKLFNPMGMMSKYHSIEKAKMESVDAFVLVNSIAMRSFINPAMPWRVMRHMSVATPKLEAAGVQFLRSYKVTETLLGDQNAEVFFLTVWPSEKIFYEVHNSEEFIEFTKANRNKAFSSFSESKVKFEVSPSR